MRHQLVIKAFLMPFITAGQSLFPHSPFQLEMDVLGLPMGTAARAAANSGQKSPFAAILNAPPLHREMQDTSRSCSDQATPPASGEHSLAPHLQVLTCHHQHKQLLRCSSRPINLTQPVAFLSDMGSNIFGYQLRA